MQVVFAGHDHDHPFRFFLTEQVPFPGAPLCPVQRVTGLIQPCAARFLILDFSHREIVFFVLLPSIIRGRLPERSD